MSTEASAKISPLKVIFGVIAIIVVVVLTTKDKTRKGPVGKSFVTQDNWTEFDFGNSSGQGDNFLNYNTQLFNNYGQPVRHINRTGTFTFEDPQLIRCKFDDAHGPFMLTYGVSQSGREFIVDEVGNRLNVFTEEDRKKMLGE